MPIRELIAQLERCVADQRAGALAEAPLVAALAAARALAARRQDLLYLQARSTSVDSPVVGMAMVRDGAVVTDLPGPEDWPYKTVLAAIRDGWRVIAFPNQALMLDESRTYGLGCEFVLERWTAG